MTNNQKELVQITLFSIYGIAVLYLLLMAISLADHIYGFAALSLIAIGWLGLFVKLNNNQNS